MHPKTCQFSYTTNVDFAAVGSQSTGEFAKVSGQGAVQVSESGYVPRYTSGKTDHRRSRQRLTATA